MSDTTETTESLALINTTKRALRKSRYLPITDRRGRVLAEVLPDADGFVDQYAEVVRSAVEVGLQRAAQ